MGADPILVRSLQRRVGNLLQDLQQSRKAQGKSVLKGEPERQAGRDLINQAIREHAQSLAEGGQPPLEWEHESALAAAIEARTFGAGRLQHLIDNDAIENIDINGCDVVHVTYADGTRARVEAVAETDEELIEQVQVLAAHAGLSSRPFDPANPELDLRLPDGSRLAAIQANTPRPAVSIRRHRYMKVSLADLVGTDTMTEEVAEFLTNAVKAKLNIMISGSTNSGKTTLLRALANEIDAEERIVSIEKALEIGLDSDPVAHPNVVVMEESLPNAEGHGGVSMAALLRRTLRLNPDRVIVGEVLGPEIVTMLNAMSQGNEGSLSTIHARSARATFDRISIYAKQAEEKLDLEATAQLIAGGLDFVVFLKKDGAKRSVREILEVNGFDGTTAVSSSLFLDDGTGNARRNFDVPVSERREDAMFKAGWRPPSPDRW